MDFVSKTFGKLMQRSIDRHMGAGLMQEENTPEGERYYTEGFPELIRKAGAEACVLLKNDGMLPLKKDEETAVFGRCQLDWFYVGYGSGGDVHPAWRVNLMEGLKNAGQPYNKALADTYTAWCAENPVDQGWWGHWPFSYPEMELDETLVRDAAKTAQTAIVVIGRAAGEDRENMLEKGSYYLTEDERTMLDLVTEHFKRVAVLMNVGSIMDMAWTEDYGARISAVLYVWQGGMESGNAAADIPCGRTRPVTAAAPRRMCSTAKPAPADASATPSPATMWTTPAAKISAAGIITTMPRGFLSATGTSTALRRRACCSPSASA